MFNKKYKSVNEIFNATIPITFDRDFVISVVTYVNDFINKDENSIQFFGSPLIGVFPVLWVNSDRNKWINNILGIELNEFDGIRDLLHELPDINKSWAVSGDPINLSCLWIAHQALVSKVLNQQERELLAHTTIDMLQYKMLTSMHRRYYPHPAQMSIAIAVYESLDNTFQLKRAGSWQGLIKLRTADILGEEGLHTKTIRTLEDDRQIVKMLNDIQSRLKSIFNIINLRYHSFLKDQKRVASTGKYLSVDGDEILKDSNTDYNLIKTAMESIIPDVNNFIREEILQAIIMTVNTASPIILYETLTFISKHYNTKIHHVVIRTMIDDILKFSFDIMRKEKMKLDDLVAVTLKMRGLLKSSRLLSPEYKKIKEDMTVIIEEANPNINTLLIPSTRIGVFLYILVRAILYQK